MTREEFHVEILRKVADAGLTPSDVGRSIRSMHPDLCKKAAISGLLSDPVAMLMLLATGMPLAAKYGGSAAGTFLGSMGDVNPYNRGASAGAVENLIGTYHNAISDLRNQNRLARLMQRRRETDIAHLRR
jgi:hypothetical protein